MPKNSGLRAIMLAMLITPMSRGAEQDPARIAAGDRVQFTSISAQGAPGSVAVFPRQADALQWIRRAFADETAGRPLLPEGLFFVGHNTRGTVRDVVTDTQAGAQPEIVQVAEITIESGSWIGAVVWVSPRRLRAIAEPDPSGPDLRASPPSWDPGYAPKRDDTVILAARTGETPRPALCYAGERSREQVFNDATGRTPRAEVNSMWPAPGTQGRILDTLGVGDRLLLVRVRLLSGPWSDQIVWTSTASVTRPEAFQRSAVRGKRGEHDVPDK
jgi:hypothetical protein